MTKSNQTDKPKTMREYMPENLVELKYQFLFKETEPIQVHEGIFEGMKIGTARVFIQKEELNKLIQSQLQSVFEEIERVIGPNVDLEDFCGPEYEYNAAAHQNALRNVQHAKLKSLRQKYLKESK